MQITDRTWFLGAVILYGISSIYSIFLYRKGFRQDNRINYALLLIGFCFHTAAMVQRGFSLQRCPINNLYEATIFLNWTIVAAYLPIGIFHRLRFLGAFASPLLFAVGVFALMPALDVKETTPAFRGGLASLHKALILLAFGGFGLSSVAALMFLTVERDLKFHKMRAVFSLLPPIQRLERVIGGLMLGGFILLTLGLGASSVFLKKTHGVWFKGDALMLYSLLVWVVYLVILVLRWRFDQKGRRIAWSAVVAFAFVMLTFWGIYLLSGLHNPSTAQHPQPVPLGRSLESDPRRIVLSTSPTEGMLC